MLTGNRLPMDMHAVDYFLFEHLVTLPYGSFDSLYFITQLQFMNIALISLDSEAVFINIHWQKGSKQECRSRVQNSDSEQMHFVTDHIT